MLKPVDAGGTFGIVLRSASGDIDDDIAVDAGKLGIDVCGKVFHTLVLKADTVEHAGCRFGHSGIVVALTGLEGGTLHHEASQTVEVDEVGELKAIAESSGGRHHRVLEGKVAYLYLKICHNGIVLWMRMMGFRKFRACLLP